MTKSINLRKGMYAELDGEIQIVLDTQHVTPGKGGGMMFVTFRNLKTGKTAKKRLGPTEDVPLVHLASKKMQFLYRDSEFFHFMDLESYETVGLDKDLVGEGAPYLKEGMEIPMLFRGEEAIRAEIPASVALKVVSTVPGMRGDTVSNVTKPATLETGIEVQVPLFINEGDTIRVDTRTGVYQGRN